jgi:hypothetical protein
MQASLPAARWRPASASGRRRGDLQHGHRARHEQRRRHAFVGDIADDEPDPPVALPEMRVEVAADRLRRLQPCLQAVAPRAAGEFGIARQHRSLDVAGNVQLALQLLLLGRVAADLVELQPDRIARALECARHHPDIVAACIVRHRPVELAVGEVACTGGELRQRHGDPSRQPQHRERRQQRDQPADQGEHPHRAVQAGEHGVATERELQAPAALADRLQHRIPRGAVARIGVVELQGTALRARGLHRRQVAATGAGHVAGQRVRKGDAPLGMHGDGAGGREQGRALAIHRAQRFKR